MQVEEHHVDGASAQVLDALRERGGVFESEARARPAAVAQTSLHEAGVGEFVLDEENAGFARRGFHGGIPRGAWGGNYISSPTRLCEGRHRQP